MRKVATGGEPSKQPAKACAVKRFRCYPLHAYWSLVSTGAPARKRMVARSNCEAWHSVKKDSVIVGTYGRKGRRAHLRQLA
jgi:hypothetical protein